MSRDHIPRKRRADNFVIRWPHLWLAMVLCLAFAGAVRAAGHLASVDHARIRLLPGNLALAGYFDLTNTGKRPLTLAGASSGAFRGVMMHLTIHSGGQTRMVQAENLEVPPGQTLHFAPGGYHLMLMDRSRPLAVGDHVPIRLEFSGGHSMEVIFTVKDANMP